jgi:hypothetical protein
MNNGDVITLLEEYSTSPGQDNTEYEDGDNELIFKMYLNDKSIVDWESICNNLFPKYECGSEGGTYITEETYVILTNIIKNHDKKKNWWK